MALGTVLSSEAGSPTVGSVSSKGHGVRAAASPPRRRGSQDPFPNKTRGPLCTGAGLQPPPLRYSGRGNGESSHREEGGLF